MMMTMMMMNTVRIQLTLLRASVAASVNGVKPRLLTAFRSAPRLISRSNIFYTLHNIMSNLMSAINHYISLSLGSIVFFIALHQNAQNIPENARSCSQINRKLIVLPNEPSLRLN